MSHPFSAFPPTSSRQRVSHGPGVAFRPVAALLAASLIACGGQGSSMDGGFDGATFDGAALDGANPDGGPLQDGAVLDAAEDAGALDAARDGGEPDACGDGVVQSDELCDGDTTECASLATSYESGVAPCRMDCSGYDVSACTRGERPVHEYVTPAARDARWADAQCSEVNEDGAPFFFTVALTGSSRWHVELGGGGFCSDTSISPCYLRPGSLVKDVEVREEDGVRRTVRIVDGEHFGAVQAPDYPTAFADANQVRLHYCSNDVWSGTRTDSVEIPADADGATTMPYRFSGRVNVRATIEALQQRFGLNDADSDLRVFVTGNSAGGFGTFVNVDQFADALPNAAADGRLHAVARAGVLPVDWADVSEVASGDWSMVRTDNGEPTGLYLEDLAPRLVELFRAEFALPCETAHPDERFRCLFANEAVPLLTGAAPEGLGLNVAVVQNLVDPFYENLHGLLTRSGSTYTYAPGGEVASGAFGDSMASSLAPLRWVYAPRHPLRFHGIRPDLPPVDTSVPMLSEVVDAFTSSRNPAEFSYFFGRFGAP